MEIVHVASYLLGDLCLETVPSREDTVAEIGHA